MATVPNQSHVSAVLRQTLDRSVVSLGQAYYGPQQELVVLKRYSLPLKPKVCVWIFFEGNDLDDVHRYRRVVKNWEVTWNQAHAFPERSLIKNAWFAVRRAFESPAPPNPIAEKRYGRLRINNEERRMYFMYGGGRLSGKDHEALEQVKLALSQAYSISAAQDCRLVVVFLPTKFRVYKEICEFPPDSDCAQWIVNDLPQQLGAIVKEISAEAGYIDLTSKFSQGGRETLFYPLDDTHWSAEGAAGAGRVISNFLEAGKYFD